MLQSHPGLDEPGREVDRVDMVEVAGELQGRAADGAADVEAPTPPFGRHVRHRRRDAGPGKVRHAEGRRAAGHGVAVVEVDVLRHQLIGLVEPRAGRHRLVARLLHDRPEPRVLEEVAAERIAGAGERLIARGDPGTANDQIVAAVERRHREVVVQRVDLEALEGHDRRPRPLPDVAHDVAEPALREGFHRAARGEVVEVDVARRPVPGRLVAGHRLTQDVPMGFGGQEHVLAGCLRQPGAVGLGLQTVHLHRPVEGQRPLVEQVPLPDVAAAAEPELRMLGPGVVQPAAALLGPQRLVAVSAGRDEAAKLRVRDEPPTGAECRQVMLLDAVLVVPAVGVVIGPLAEADLAGGDREPLVRRGRPARGAGGPQPLLLGRELGAVPQFSERHLSHDHARRLEVDPLVLDPHEDHPGRGVPGDRQFERHRLDEVVDEFPHGGPVAADGGDRRPVVMGRVEVVPRHLVHAHGHHRLEPGVEPGGDVTAGRQFVDVEHRRMGEVKDQRVAERLVADVIGSVVADQGEQPIVDLARLVEVAAQFGPLGGHGVGRGGVGREEDGAGGGQRRGKIGGPLRGAGGASGGGLHGTWRSRGTGALRICNLGNRNTLPQAREQWVRNR